MHQIIVALFQFAHYFCGIIIAENCQNLTKNCSSLKIDKKGAKKMKEKKERKITYNKVMTLRDYANLAYFLETGEYERDFTGCDPKALLEEKKYSMRLTKEDKKLVDKFFDRFKLGVSANTIFASIPKEKKIQQPVIIQQVVGQPAAQTLQPPAAVNGDPYNSKPPVVDSEETKTTKVYPVYTNDERWELAEQLEREAVDRYNEPFDENIDKTEFYFVKDCNKPANDLTNFEPMLALKMIFDGKVDPSEVAEAVGAKGSWMFSTPCTEMNGIHPDFKKRYSQLTPAMLEMQQLGKQYRSIMSEDEPADPEKKFVDYALRLGRELDEVKAQEIKDLQNSFIDKIDTVKGDTIYLVSDDPDVETPDEINFTYDNADDLKNDLMILARKYNFDLDQPIDVFGKKTSYRKIVKEYEKQYPHGVKGLYFKTAKEEYLAGKLLLGGFMGVDFQWRVEK